MRGGVHAGGLSGWAMQRATAGQGVDAMQAISVQVSLLQSGYGLRRA